jgi:hypothetical protein
MIAVLPVLASTLITERLSGRRPVRSAPASPPIIRKLYRPSDGSRVGPEPEKMLPMALRLTLSR